MAVIHVKASRTELNEVQLKGGSAEQLYSITPEQNEWLLEIASLAQPGDHFRITEFVRQLHRARQEDGRVTVTRWKPQNWGLWGLLGRRKKVEEWDFE